MITEKEKKMFDTEYFNILLINGFAISVQSKNTKHYWHIEEEEFAHFRHFKLYHKHNRSDEFHRHRDRKNMAAVIDEIKEHDKFQMNGEWKKAMRDISHIFIDKLYMRWYFYNIRAKYITLKERLL